MVESMSSSQFHSRTDLPEWRVLRRRIEATFLTGSFEAASRLVEQIAAAAEVANHHPDVDVRYPDRVHVALTTHAASGLTSADVALATKISELAVAARASSEPTASAAVEIAIDALDIDAVRPFWKAVLGYVDEPASEPDGQVDTVLDPNRIGPSIWFQQMDAPRPQRNRIHIDVFVPHDVAASRISAAIDAGGRLVTAEYARAFWVLADPEGNEACICTWQDRE